MWNALTISVVCGCVLVAQPSSTGNAISAIQEFEKVCDEGRELWKMALCGRLFLVDPQTRVTIANTQNSANTFTPDHGAFIGKLPPTMMTANTSVEWDGERWAMIVLPLPEEKYARLKLMTHESFHRLQPKLKLNAVDAVNKHLDTEEGRLWLRLELRALAQAMRLGGASARKATTDALLFRAERRRLFPDAAANEAALEISEGLAEYTGTVVALKATREVLERVARAVESGEAEKAMARSFAYSTGPAIGMLLDRYSPNWRRHVQKDSDLSALLAQSIHYTIPADINGQAKARADIYGFQAIREDEHGRDVRNQVRLAMYRTKFITGPVLQFPKSASLSRSFNPNNLVPLDEDGIVYPTGTFMADWGKLEIEDVGALLSPDNTSLRVAAPYNVHTRPIKGPGWTLDLEPGWILKEGSRPGDFLVAKEN